MFKTTEIRNSSCCASFKELRESRITHAILVTGIIASLVLGILASAGVFNVMGVANALQLSYGMYAVAALCASLEIINLAVSHCKKSDHSKAHEGQEFSRRIENAIEEGTLEEECGRITDSIDELIQKQNIADNIFKEHIQEIKIKNACDQTKSCTHMCTISLKDGRTKEIQLKRHEITRLLKPLLPGQNSKVIIEPSSNNKKSIKDWRDALNHFNEHIFDETVVEILARIGLEISSSE